MELPYHLKTLEPLAGALEILRYLGEIDTEADVNEICEALDLSDRRFNKAIRRLVTKGYVQMTGDMVYKLSDQGIESYHILQEYDETAPASSGGGSADVDEVSRRLVLAMPEKLVAQQPNTIIVAIDGGTDGAVEVPADMIVRLSVLNGDPFTPEDEILELANDPIQHEFTVTPDAFTKCRVKVQVYQLGPNPDDISVSGGLYVDADVIGAPSTSNTTVAYGADISVQVFD